VPESTQRGASSQKIGYSNVRVMSAGITGWLAAKLPTESGESTP
jgi:rhodanese-related sulfurtransferase